ncbi:uncharacterized protein LOC131299683 [Rhododendron vialii]|uniref:uncharacterized protein LOC131299683 n=1 Tax=Rhododendron vialii TaxID=182163 RepID=UPI00265FE4DE|nr:uncharacterized protein LOC131299683 [Rhododendron vialii]
MEEENPMTPLDPKNLLGGGGDKSPPGAPRKPEGGHGKRGGQDGYGVRRSKSGCESESVAHSRSVHNNGDILDKKRQKIEEFARLIKKREHKIRELEQIREHPEDYAYSRRNSRGDRHAMVDYKKAPSRIRRSRSPTPRRNKIYPRRRRSKCKSRTQERKRTSSRKRRSRSRYPTPEEEGTRKHHRDRYERLDSDWERSAPKHMKEREEGTMSAREVARKALSNIASSPFAKRLQGARLPGRVKHGAFILY